MQRLLVFPLIGSGGCFSFCHFGNTSPPELKAIYDEEEHFSAASSVCFKHVRWTLAEQHFHCDSEVKQQQQQSVKLLPRQQELSGADGRFHRWEEI